MHFVRAVDRIILIACRLLFGLLFAIALTYEITKSLWDGFNVVFPLLQNAIGDTPPEFFAAVPLVLVSAVLVRKFLKKRKIRMIFSRLQIGAMEE